MKRVIFLLFIGISSISLPALSATIFLEGYDFSILNGEDIYTTTLKINAYANGVQVLSDSICTHAEPCKLTIEKKSFLTICKSRLPSQCHTGILVDPTESNLQRFGYTTNLGAYYTVYRPQEMPVLDSFVAKQMEAEKQRDEIKKRAPY